MKRSIEIPFLIKSILLVTLFINSFFYLQAQQIGDPGLEFDNTKNDPNYPFMIEWQNAGVEGGVPNRSSNSTKASISPTNSDGIQQAINTAITQNKPFVILLKKGIYIIDKPIRMRSNIILRGEDKNDVKLNVSIRSNANRTISSIAFNNITKAALEDLTFEYMPPQPIMLYDDTNVPRNTFCGDRCFNNNPEGINNMYVSFVKMDGATTNCWVQNCNFKNSGTDPLEIRANHNTFRNNFVDGAFNRGGGGNAYYDITGDYNLITNEKVRRIRHFAIQLGAKYNVVIGCNLEVDVNFHNKDDGFNLVENNTIKSERWRSWGAFASGATRFGHDKPGSNNIIFNNNTSGRGNSADFSTDQKVFVFDQFMEPRLLINTPPLGGTFYPIILENESNLSTEDFLKTNKKFTVYPNPTSNASMVTFNNLKNKTINLIDSTGKVLKTINISSSNYKLDTSNLSAGIYFIKNDSNIAKLIVQ